MSIDTLGASDGLFCYSVLERKISFRIRLTIIGRSLFYIKYINYHKNFYCLFQHIHIGYGGEQRTSAFRCI